MSKYVRWQVLLTLLGILLVASLLFYVSTEEKTASPTPTLIPSSATTVIQARGGTYIEGVAGYPQLINPLFSPFNDVDRDLCTLIFQGLTAVNERNEIVPLLAERWQVSDDGLEYVFYLRDDVRWQDGQAFTADDVAFTIGLVQSPELAFHPHAALWQSVVVEKLSPFAIKFMLAEPYASFLDYTVQFVQHGLQSPCISFLFSLMGQSHLIQSDTSQKD